MDIYGPIKKEESGLITEIPTSYLLVMVDGCTRWTEISIIESLESSDVIKEVYNNWLSRYPLPEVIHTDKGKSFISYEFKEFAARFGIKTTTTIGNNPTGNSIVERVNQKIGNILRIYKGYEMNSIVSLIRNSINNTHHSSLNTAPCNLVFGVNKFICKKNYDKIKLLEESINRNKGSIEKSHADLNKRRIDSDLMGKKVWIKNKPRHKLEEKNLGPFTITDSKPHLGIIEIDCGNFKKWINISKIARCDL